MERPKDEQTPWALSTERGMRVVARRGDAESGGEEITAQLCVDDDAPALRLRIDHYTRVVTRRDVEELPAPKDLIEAWANEPAQALDLLSDFYLGRPELDGDYLPPGALALPNVRRAGKKPDRFYAEVLRHQRACERRGVPYAHAVGADNQVEPGVVYRWVVEAKRRGIELDSDGKAFIDGVPVDGDDES